MGGLGSSSWALSSPTSVPSFFFFSGMMLVKLLGLVWGEYGRLALLDDVLGAAYRAGRVDLGLLNSI